MTEFTTTNLVDGRVLVTGTDQFGTSGRTVLDGGQWAEVNRRDDYSQANDAFDRAVEEFFKPLTDAVESREKALERPTDSLAYVVLCEGTEGKAAQQENLVKLTKDSMILRAIETGETGRLVWVEEHIEILDVLSVKASVSASRGSAKKTAAKKTAAKKK